MALEFKLPDIGEGTVEGEIVRWLVEPGQAVEADQPIVEVMTDKATVVLSAPKAGTITDIRAEPGDVVAVGTVIYVLDAAAGAAAAPAAVTSSAAASAGGNGSSATAVLSAPPAPPPSGRRKPLATPATRRVARELGIDLTLVTGSGPAGRITREDVERFAHDRAAALTAPAAVPAPASTAPTPKRAAPPPRRAAAPRPGSGGVERVPFRGLRKATAQAMVRSKFTATHFTYVDEVDVTELVALRRRAKGRLLEQGVKLSYLPFIMKAVTEALRRHPWLNAELDEQAQEVLLKRDYHIGVSIQAERGLYVGVVRDVDRLSVVEVARALATRIDQVRAGRAAPQDLRGSTFTITSAGNIGGLFATPIINYPEVAILGVHRIKRRPVVVTDAAGNEQIAIRDIMYLSISVDHRVVDGAAAAEFMNDVIGLLADPGRLLLGA